MKDGTLGLWGLGFYPPEETTLETLMGLEECEIVYCDLIDQKDFNWLQSYCPNLRKPVDAEEVVRAVSSRKKVGLATWGHPQYTSELAREVRRLCRKKGVFFQVFAANSPIGTTLAYSINFLGAEGYMGVQGYELKAFLKDCSIFTPLFPLIVFAQDGSKKDWNRLISFLRPKYPVGHQARVYSRGKAGEQSVSLNAPGEASWGGATLMVLPVLPPGAAAPLPRRWTGPK